MKSENHVPPFRAGRTSETAGSVSGLWSPGVSWTALAPRGTAISVLPFDSTELGTDTEMPN